MEDDEQLAQKMVFINEASLSTMRLHDSSVIKTEIELENEHRNNESLVMSTGEEFEERHILVSDDKHCTIGSDEENVNIGSSNLSLFENSEKSKIEIDTADEEYIFANDNSNVMNSENERRVETDKFFLSNCSQQVKLENCECANSSVFHPMTTLKEENQVWFNAFRNDMKLEVKQEDVISSITTSCATRDEGTTYGDAYSEFTDEKPTQLPSNIQLDVPLNLNTFEKLSKGCVFSSFEDFQHALNDYCARSGTIFTKKNAMSVEYANKKIVNEQNKYPSEWRYKSVQFQCKHYGLFNPADNTDRRQRDFSTFKTGCTARIRLHANKKEKGLVVIDVNLDHSTHRAISTSEAIIYPENRRLDEAQKKEMHSLFGMNMKPVEIIKYFLQNHGLALTQRDIHNHRAKQRKTLSTGNQLTKENSKPIPSTDPTHSSLHKSKLKLRKKLIVSKFPFISHEIDNIYKLCTPYAARVMKLELEKSFQKAYVVGDGGTVLDPNGKSYTVVNGRCDCFVSQSRKFVCSHIFAYRQHLNVPLFTIADVSSQHSLDVGVNDTMSNSLSSSSSVSVSSNGRRVLSQTEKFRLATCKLKEFVDVLSNLGQDEFDCHLDMFVEITNSIKRGKTIMWMEGDHVNNIVSVDEGSESLDHISNASCAPQSVSHDSVSIASSQVSLSAPRSVPLASEVSLSGRSVPLASEVSLSARSVSLASEVSSSPRSVPLASEVSSHPLGQAPVCASESLSLNPDSNALSIANKNDDFNDTTLSFEFPSQVKKRGRPKQGRTLATKKRKILRGLSDKC